MTIIYQPLVQNFNELTPDEKTEALDSIYYDLLDQYGIYIDDVMSMPFQNAQGVPIGRTVATIGDGVLIGRISKRMGDMIEIIADGVPYTANELYVSEVH